MPNFSLSLLVFIASMAHAKRSFRCGPRLVPIVFAFGLAAPRAIAAETETLCQTRPTDVTGSLGTWRAAGPADSPYWTIDTSQNVLSSKFEIQSQYNGLGFVLGRSPARVTDALDEARREMPILPLGWGREDYARMGEAALIRARPVAEAMTYLDRVYALGKFGWSSLDYSRAAAAGFIVDVPPESVARTMREAYRLNRSWWTNQTFSRVAESALLANRSTPDAMEMIDVIYRTTVTMESGWREEYVRVGRAALIRNLPPRDAAAVLGATYRQIRLDRSSRITWNYRDFARMAAAAIITRKSPADAARALQDTWNNRTDSDAWDYADYSTIAAAALMGRGDEREPCASLLRSW